MNKFIFFSLILIFSFFSCRKPEKNFEDYFPSLSVSATVLVDGSVQLKATIVKEGVLPIESAGFAYDVSPVFSIDKNQIIVSEMVNNSFTVTYPPGFDLSKTYYFKAWITNQLGYKATEAVALTGIEATPVDGPCTNPMDYMYVYATTETAGTPSAWTDDVDFNKYITVNGSYSSLRLTFDQIPITGVYTTTTATPGVGEVNVSINNTFSGFISSMLEPGQNVYVNQTSPTSWTFEICSATYMYSSLSFTMSAYFDK